MFNVCVPVFLPDGTPVILGTEEGVNAILLALPNYLATTVQELRTLRSKERLNDVDTFLVFQEQQVPYQLALDTDPKLFRKKGYRIKYPRLVGLCH